MGICTACYHICSITCPPRAHCVPLRLMAFETITEWYERRRKQISRERVRYQHDFYLLLCIVCFSAFARTDSHRVDGFDKIVINKLCIATTRMT